MSSEIQGRPVLRPAGNVAPARANARKPSKPPLLKPSPPPKASPPSSQPTTPRASPAATVPPSPTRSPVLKPKLPPSSSPRKTSLSPKPCNYGPAPVIPSPPPINPAPIASPAPDMPWVPPQEPSPHPDPLPHPPRPPLSKTRSPNPSSQRRMGSQISLTKSSCDAFQKTTAVSASKLKPSSKKNMSKLGSVSLDETAIADIAAAKKAAASELYAQRKLRAAEYGRKQGKASRVAPDVASPSSTQIEPQRCKFITAQSDPLYVAYHDQEWGVPVHDDRLLFELLVLSGAQVELSWTTILQKRDLYRAVFSGFDPAVVAAFSEKHIQLLEADRSLMLPGGKIRGVIENAQHILQVAREFGSLDNYLWGFVNNKPMINNYRYPKQVPVKTSKSETISKDLVKRGFRFVGPTIIYSFMQAAGMTNDHLMQCFRHQECVDLALSLQDAMQPKLEQLDCFASFETCELFSLQLDLCQELQTEELLFHDDHEGSLIWEEGEHNLHEYETESQQEELKEQLEDCTYGRVEQINDG